jgi:hypothetical protein
LTAASRFEVQGLGFETDLTGIELKNKIVTVLINK